MGNNSFVEGENRKEINREHFKIISCYGVHAAVEFMCVRVCVYLLFLMLDGALINNEIISRKNINFSPVECQCTFQRRRGEEKDFFFLILAFFLKKGRGQKIREFFQIKFS